MLHGIVPAGVGGMGAGAADDGDAGGGDTAGAGEVAGRNGGPEHAEVGLLAVPELSGGVVAERLAGGDVAEFRQEHVELFEGGRHVHLRVEQFGRRLVERGGDAEYSLDGGKRVVAVAVGAD